MYSAKQSTGSIGPTLQTSIMPSVNTGIINFIKNCLIFNLSQPSNSYMCFFISANLLSANYSSESFNYYVSVALVSFSFLVLSLQFSSSTLRCSSLFQFNSSSDDKQLQGLPSLSMQILIDSIISKVEPSQSNSKTSVLFS